MDSLTVAASLRKSCNRAGVSASLALRCKRPRVAPRTFSGMQSEASGGSAGK